MKEYNVKITSHGLLILETEDEKYYRSFTEEECNICEIALKEYWKLYNK